MKIFEKIKSNKKRSDTILITEDGYLKLTKAPEKLEELIIK